ncbi:sugar phosphate isomerase/epimerase family protein [Runella slithyformis]|nr:sugar phosphate isomerase/epimerase family protein [Runella slithyformis]
MTVREYAHLCKNQGLDGFDLGSILLKNHTPKYVSHLKKEIEEEGIPLIMVTAYPDFTHPEALQRMREFDFLVHDIALASALGAKYLRVTAGQAHPGVSVAEGIEWAINSLKKAAAVSDQYGITLVYENHAKPGVWEYMDFSNPPEIFLKIAEGLRNTSIGINFDTANILVAGHETTLEVLEEVYDKVLTIHVADTASIGKMAPVALGTGLVPFREIFHYLKEKEFNGWLCLEEFGNNGEEGVKQAIDFVRSTWIEA